MYLTTQVQDRNDYINAVRCDSFTKQNAFILTQVPLKDTIPDLWRLVNDHSVSSIVLLNRLDTEEPYWSSEPQEYGPLSINLVAESKPSEGITIRDFELRHQDGYSEVYCRTVRQYHLNIWNDDETEFINNPTALKSLYTLISCSTDEQSKEDTVVIQCLDGVVRSSMFVLFYNVLEMLESAQPVDIPFALKLLRSARPQAVNTFNQYFTLYNWIIGSQTKAGNTSLNIHTE